MKIVFSFLSLAFLILFSAEKISAQNLVPNPSFEDYSNCPATQDQVYFSIGWSAFGASSDYFNSCSIPGTESVPSNEWGNQNAAAGNGYCGLVAFVSVINDSREFLGRQLTTQLIPGTKYYVSIKANLGDSSNYACNNLGVLFSTVPFSEWVNPVQIVNHSQIFSQAIISDKINWTNIQGSFISDSAYKYIVIGNFFHDNLTDTLLVGPILNTFNEAYYYIDDVCVSPDSLECDLNPEGIYNLAQKQIAIYPNPATEQLIIDNGQLIIKGIEVFDLVGRKMMGDEVLTNNFNHYSINTKNFPRGYYFIRINTSQGIINRKIVLQ